ncbi:MAG: helix-turn-helix transcriptional regulator [Pseudomonadota bacterium]
MKRGLSTLTESALVCLGGSHEGLCLTTNGSADMQLRKLPSVLPQALAGKLAGRWRNGLSTSPGNLVGSRFLDVGAPEGEWLRKILPSLDGWKLLELSFDTEIVDHIALKLDTADAAKTAKTVLDAIWPILREDCLQDLLERPMSAAKDALLWTISKNVGAAILVLDAAGNVLQANQAGSALLKSGQFLRETPEGLQCHTSKETKALRFAISECLDQAPGKSVEMIMLLEVMNGLGRAPLSLSCYNDGTDNPLIVAMIPQKPDRKRVEMLAQKMGLTPAEARVAALMQMGLSNREASCIAQVKEQTFNTYAKRVLAKLNVSCRAEMAQLLTWQASVGRAS